MKNIRNYLFFLSFALTFAAKAQTLPFSIYLEPVSISGLTGVQSFSHGYANGKWLIVGGRLDGLHKSMGMGMMGTPFPASANNNDFIVIDPTTLQYWAASNCGFIRKYKRAVKCYKCTIHSRRGLSLYFGGLWLSKCKLYTQNF